jgi:hypothetical protein
MTAPTSLVRNHVVRLFPAQEQEEVTRLLQEDCGTALPGTDNASAEFFERVQCAALKLSAGRMDRLYDAIALAHTDWRDLLVAAGFADDIHAHEGWIE